MPVVYSMGAKLLTNSQSESTMRQSKRKKCDAHLQGHGHHKPCIHSSGNRYCLLFHRLAQNQKREATQQTTHRYIKTTNNYWLLLDVAQTPHCTKTYWHNWWRDHCARTGMTACTFPGRVRSQIARIYAQCTKLIGIFFDNPMQTTHESIILVVTRKKATFGRSRVAHSTTIPHPAPQSPHPPPPAVRCLSHPCWQKIHLDLRIYSMQEQELGIWAAAVAAAVLVAMTSNFGSNIFLCGGGLARTHISRHAKVCRHTWCGVNNWPQTWFYVFTKYLSSGKAR